MDKTEFLLEGVKYYSEDVNRRCTGFVNGKCTCFYSPKTIGKENISKGCMIGRVLTDELKEVLDTISSDDTSVENILYFMKLPEEIRNFGVSFLIDCQSLHDYDCFWSTEGLNKSGIIELLQIIKNHNLDESAFSKYIGETNN